MSVALDPYQPTSRPFIRCFMTTQELLAFHATLSEHGRVIISGKPERVGFVMATVKDANDSDGFLDIRTDDFIFKQSLLARRILLNPLEVS